MLLLLLRLLLLRLLPLQLLFVYNLRIVEAVSNTKGAVYLTVRLLVLGSLQLPMPVANACSECM